MLEPARVSHRMQRFGQNTTQTILDRPHLLVHENNRRFERLLGQVHARRHRSGRRRTGATFHRLDALHTPHRRVQIVRPVTAGQVARQATNQPEVRIGRV